MSVGGLGKLVAQEPELMGVNIGKLTRTVRFLEDVGFRQKQIGNMLVAFPKLIQYRSEVLRPKWRFLRKQMGLSLEALLTFPRCGFGAVWGFLEVKKKTLFYAGSHELIV